MKLNIDFFLYKKIKKIKLYRIFKYTLFKYFVNYFILKNTIDFKISNLYYLFQNTFAPNDYESFKSNFREKKFIF